MSPYLQVSGLFIVWVACRVLICLIDDELACELG